MTNEDVKNSQLTAFAYCVDKLTEEQKNYCEEKIK